MNTKEFREQFDVLYNNITSNQAPGLNDYEISVFLTKAEKEITKNYFSANSQGNTLKQGFDDSAKRQADFSVLLIVDNCEVLSDSSSTVSKFYCTSSTNYTKEFAGNHFAFKDGDNAYSLPKGTYSIASASTITVSGNSITVIPDMPYSNGNLTKTDVVVPEGIVAKIDTRSAVCKYPTDVFIVINEAVLTDNNELLQVIPLKYDEYIRLMSKPYKRPTRYQAWRLINTGNVANGQTSTKYVELIAGPNESIQSYTIRYIRAPKPIIVGDLDGLTIDGYTYSANPSTDTETDGECELDPILHDDILQRAVELAKIAWTNTGQDNMQAVMTAGTRSE